MLTLAEVARDLEARGRPLYDGPAVLVEAVGAPAMTEVASASSAEGPSISRKTWTTAVVKVGRNRSVPPPETDRLPVRDLTSVVDHDSEVLPIEKREANVAAAVCIGRAKRNDVVVHDLTISSRHASVEVDERGRAFLTDQGSSNGTFVNRVQLRAAEAVLLTPGDCVRLGQKVYYYMNPALLTEVLTHLF